MKNTLQTVARLVFAEKLSHALSAAPKNDSRVVKCKFLSKPLRRSGNKIERLEIVNISKIRLVFDRKINPNYKNDAVWTLWVKLNRPLIHKNCLLYINDAVSMPWMKILWKYKAATFYSIEINNGWISVSYPNDLKWKWWNVWTNILLSPLL